MLRMACVFPLATVLVGAIAACVPCNNIGCAGGFELDLVAPGGLNTGQYELELEIDGESHDLRCTIDAEGLGECVDGQPTSGFTIETSVYPVDGLAQIKLRIVDQRESEGDFIAYRGPEQVEIEVVVDGAVVGMAAFEPDYERSNHRGDEICGYCDVTEAEQIALMLN